MASGTINVPYTTTAVEDVTLTLDTTKVTWASGWGGSAIYRVGNFVFIRLYGLRALADIGTSATTIATISRKSKATVIFPLFSNDAILGRVGMDYNSYIIYANGLSAGTSVFATLIIPV